MEKYISHEGENFLVINAKDYCLARQDQLFVGSKFASVTARKGRVGEKIKTIMPDGLTETTNVVSYDASTGEPDWVVTQASGEQMVVNDTKYNNLYEVQNIAENQTIKPSGKYRPMIRVNENIALKTSWGEIQYIKAGGVLVIIDSNDIYGIQKQQFESSYNIIEGADAQKLFNENLNKQSVSRLPTIFLSVAYPYENKDNQNFMKQVISYINSKGIKAINIRKIEGDNANLINEISSALKDSEGILSLAFNKGGNQTSPFIQIESALACSMNLENLMIVPKDIRRDGMLYDQNMHGKIYEIQDEKNLFSVQNKHIVESIDNFAEEIIKRYKLKINNKDLAKFKNGLAKIENSGLTKAQIVSFLKNFYNVHHKNFDFNNIYVKRPTQIKAMMITQSGVYETKDGKVYLNKGDFLVLDATNTAKPYSVKQEEFIARYIKVNGKQDTYIPKLIPTIANKKNDKIEIFGLIDPEDVYCIDKSEFALKYQSLEEYILGLQEEISTENINEL